MSTSCKRSPRLAKLFDLWRPPCYTDGMFKVEVEQENDGRWIAEVPELPGAMVYGKTREEAVTRAQALALRILAERLEHGEELPQVEAVFSIVAA